MADALRAPFPYFGGKSRVAEIVWRALGADVPSYVEFFAGSAAVLLARPGGGWKYEKINDASGFVANAWRALKYSPAAVAEFCEEPPVEVTLRARAKWLRERGPSLVAELSADPEAHDAKAAGYWVWCQAAAIGAHWEEGTPSLHTHNCRGVLALTRPPLRDWFGWLAQRLSRVMVTCGDWSRLATPSALGLVMTGTTPIGVFADPPYPNEATDYGAGADVAVRVTEWCLANGDDQRFRIILAGHVGDYELPGWSTVNWGGSRGFGRSTRGENECLWFSPHCLPLEGAAQCSLFSEVST